MKKWILRLLDFISAICIAVGVIPYIFDFPISTGPQSGPKNMYELIVMLCYENRMLKFGLIMFIFCIYLNVALHRRSKKIEDSRQP